MSPCSQLISQLSRGERGATGWLFPRREPQVKGTVLRMVERPRARERSFCSSRQSCARLPARHHRAASSHLLSLTCVASHSGGLRCFLFPFEVPACSVLPDLTLPGIEGPFTPQQQTLLQPGSRTSPSGASGYLDPECYVAPRLFGGLLRAGENKTSSPSSLTTFNQQLSNLTVSASESLLLSVSLITPSSNPHLPFAQTTPKEQTSAKPAISLPGREMNQGLVMIRKNLIFLIANYAHTRCVQRKQKTFPQSSH